ncbi:C-terminal binding protein [Natronomonas sp. F2-12]|jgi:D-3-phosphoglycerate dehydrogenase|uniref:C-terminal binding protein n=1 Tax=Natronomonas aquatica TaxID=2841590 RepID=A0A9R1CQX5_9EURY|nr:C-terminal binding protein [Natronomonas aquatica]MCQ4332106.1 C-terminal binding protein [Natronomonas aquatica]
MEKTILVTDQIYGELDIEREITSEAGIELVERQLESAEAVSEAIEETGADALALTFADISRSVLERADGLEAVGRYGIGVDTIDVPAATENGTVVLNVPDYAIDEVSTHAFALLLACVRSVTAYDRDIKEGGWDWEIGAPIPRLSESTLGLAGFGKIPRRVAEKAAGFGLEVLAQDPYIDADEMEAQGVEKVGFGELLDRSDFVSVHTPLTEETEGMFGSSEFERMKDSAILVNTSRGAVVDVPALNAALEAGEIAGAGLDVLPEEPPADDEPIVDREDVIMTPHAAWYSEPSIVELRKTLFSDLVGILQGEEPTNPVNPDVL